MPQELRIVDYRHQEDFDRAARAEQKRLAAALPPDLRDTPRWRLVQIGAIPSLRELKERLPIGGESV